MVSCSDLPCASHPHPTRPVFSLYYIYWYSRWIQLWKWFFYLQGIEFSLVYWLWEKTFVLLIVFSPCPFLFPPPVSQHKCLGAARRAVEAGLDVAGFGRFHCDRIFESNIELNLRFMVDKSVTGCCWVKLSPGTYRVRPEATKKSFCQVLAHVYLFVRMSVNMTIFVNEFDCIQHRASLIYMYI